MKRAFTLIELLVVIAIISILMALGFPVMRKVREQGAETICKSNLRQMAAILKTYCDDHDNLFPEPSVLYHSSRSYWSFGDPNEELKPYLACCRWHDARIGFDSPLWRRKHRAFQGSLGPYLGDVQIVRCKKGVRANTERGCYNHCRLCEHDPAIPIVPQYTYCMNGYLHSWLTTGRSASGSIHDKVDFGTIRHTEIHRETQVTRSPSDVFAFGEQNSWAINSEGRQPIGVIPELAAPYDLSGKHYKEIPWPSYQGDPGTLGPPVLDIETTYRLSENGLEKKSELHIGDAFATCHRPHKGDLNAGHSYVSMLDGHVRQVTAADQLRKSRRVPGLPESRLGPGGNLYLAWPLDVPPLGGWENQ
jgi:prepilin-type N-terminal cleavage/methylation domain-containing protein